MEMKNFTNVQGTTKFVSSFPREINQIEELSNEENLFDQDQDDKVTKIYVAKKENKESQLIQEEKNFEKSVPSQYRESKKEKGHEIKRSNHN